MRYGGSGVIFGGLVSKSGEEGGEGGSSIWYSEQIYRIGFFKYDKAKWTSFAEGQIPPADRLGNTSPLREICYEVALVRNA